MKFFKDNSYDIVRLYINQIGITIFSMVLYAAVGFLEDSDLKLELRIVLSVFATIFYLALIYTASWEYGAKDKIKVDSGKLRKLPGKGAILSFLANLPNFLIAGLAVICMTVYMSGGAEGFFTAFGVFNLIIRFCSAMYIGIIQGVFSAVPDGNLLWLLESVGYLVLPLLSVAVTQLGYSFGSRNFRILSVFSGGKNNGDRS